MREMNQERSIKKKVAFQQSPENQNLLNHEHPNRGRKYPLKIKIGNIAYSKL